MESFLAALILLTTGYIAGGVKVINESNKALVERLGRYHKTLEPGINWIAPIIDTVVWEDTTREQILAIGEQKVFTKDSVSLTVEAYVYWRILDMELAYYEVDNVEEAIRNRVATAMNAEIGRRELDQAVSGRNELNKIILHQIADETESWGLKVLRVDIQNLIPSAAVIASMEKEKAAKIDKQAELQQAEGTAGYLRKIAEALSSQSSPPTSRDMLHFLLTERYVEATAKLSQSNNAKVVFMDPKALSEALEPAMGMDVEVSAKDKSSNVRLEKEL
jgi:regulator of protease activity HflC (stomatin/prohibitin superfamily)